MPARRSSAPASTPAGAASCTAATNAAVVRTPSRCSRTTRRSSASKRARPNARASVRRLHAPAAIDHRRVRVAAGAVERRHRRRQRRPERRPRAGSEPAGQAEHRVVREALVEPRLGVLVVADDPVPPLVRDLVRQDRERRRRDHQLRVLHRQAGAARDPPRPFDDVELVAPVRSQPARVAGAARCARRGSRAAPRPDPPRRSPSAGRSRRRPGRSSRAAARRRS